MLENLTGHVVMVSRWWSTHVLLGTDGFELVVPMRDVVIEDVAGVPVTSFGYDVPDNLPAKRPGVLLVVTEQAALALQLVLQAAGVDRDDIVFPSSNGLRRLATPGAQASLRLEVNELDPELLDKLEELDARGVFGPPQTTWPPKPPTAEEVARGAQGRAPVPPRWAASVPDDEAAAGPAPLKPPCPPVPRTDEPPKVAEPRRGRRSDQLTQRLRREGRCATEAGYQH